MERESSASSGSPNVAVWLTTAAAILHLAVACGPGAGSSSSPATPTTDEGRIERREVTVRTADGFATREVEYVADQLVVRVPRKSILGTPGQLTRTARVQFAAPRDAETLRIRRLLHAQGDVMAGFAKQALPQLATGQVLAFAAGKR